MGTGALIRAWWPTAVAAGPLLASAVLSIGTRSDWPLGVAVAVTALLVVVMLRRDALLAARRDARLRDLIARHYAVGLATQREVSENRSGVRSLEEAVGRQQTDVEALAAVVDETGTRLEQISAELRSLTADLEQRSALRARQRDAVKERAIRDVHVSGRPRG